MSDYYSDITALNSIHINKVSELHKKSLPNDILPLLGTDILNSYYKEILSSDKDKFRIYGIFYKKDYLIGCIQLSFDSFSILRIIKLKTIFQIIVKSIISPRIVFNGFIQFLHYSNLNFNEAEISFFFVSEEHQRKRLGTKLIKHISEISKQYCKKKIVTKTSNLQLSNFYQKELGANVRKRFRTLNSTYQELEFNINN